MSAIDTAPSPSPSSAVHNLLSRALKKRRIPITASLELTLRCNLRCDHCYLGSDRKRDELSTDEVKGILDGLAQAGTLLLTLTGGEVFLRHDFAEIYRYAIGKGFLVTVFTNATLLKSEHVELFRSLPPRLVEISLYGLTDDDYDSFTHARVSFAQLDANLRSLRDAGVTMLLKSVATVTLGPKVRAMRAYADSLGVQFRFATVVYGAHDATALADNERPSAETVCGHERDIVARDVPERVPLPPAGNRVFHCGAGRIALHIDAEGVMSRCGMVRTALAGRVDLRETTVADAWRQLGVGLDDELAEGHPCRDCKLRSLCSRCPATSTPEQEIAMCETTHARAREAGYEVSDLAPMRLFWQPAATSILKRRFRG